MSLKDIFAIVNYLRRITTFLMIQGYKGLDSKVVILVDVDKIKEDSYSKLIYTAISRAQTLLYVIGNYEFWKKHGEKPDERGGKE